MQISLESATTGDETIGIGVLENAKLRPAPRAKATAKDVSLVVLIMAACFLGEFMAGSRQVALLRVTSDEVLGCSWIFGYDDIVCVRLRLATSFILVEVGMTQK
jgi:hypothetical protein